MGNCPASDSPVPGADFFFSFTTPSFLFFLQSVLLLLCIVQCRFTQRRIVLHAPRGSTTHVASINSPLAPLLILNLLDICPLLLAFHASCPPLLVYEGAHLPDPIGSSIQVRPRLLCGSSSQSQIGLCKHCQIQISEDTISSTAPDARLSNVILVSFACPPLLVGFQPCLYCILLLCDSDFLPFNNSSHEGFLQHHHCQHQHLYIPSFNDVQADPYEHLLHSPSSPAPFATRLAFCYHGHDHTDASCWWSSPPSSP